MSNKLDILADIALDAQIALDEAKERFEEAKSAFIDEAKKQGKYDTSLKAAGHAKVTLSPNHYFDSTVAQGMVTKKVLKECTVPKVDDKLLKANLTPNQLEKAMKSYSTPYKVGFKVLED